MNYQNINVKGVEQSICCPAKSIEEVKHREPEWHVFHTLSRYNLFLLIISYVTSLGKILYKIQHNSYLNIKLLTMIVRGEIYINMLKTSQTIPTIKDLPVVPWNTNIVIRTMAAKKMASRRSQNPISFWN